MRKLVNRDKKCVPWNNVKYITDMSLCYVIVSGQIKLEVFDSLFFFRIRFLNRFIPFISNTNHHPSYSRKGSWQLKLLHVNWHLV